MVHVQDELIREGLDQVANLTIAISKIEQVNPAREEISKYYVKSIMIYAILEQLIAVDSLVISMDPAMRKQLEMELKRIIKTNIY